ncbi:MAG: hypothetical protein J7507_05665 [Pseudoxanthomonas sp.]|nr:hypothetical protein [Pseudoxanthomonas sp.]
MVMHVGFRAASRVAAFAGSVVLLGCMPPSPEQVENRKLQSLRSSIITEFAMNTDDAHASYIRLLDSSERDIETLGAKAVICGQLRLREFPIDRRCKTILEQAVQSERVALRAIGVSAHAFFLDEAAQEVLFDGLSDRSEKVRHEAVMALEFQFDTLTADPNDPTAGRRLRERLVRICPAIRSGGSLYSDLCRKAESPDELR